MSTILASCAQVQQISDAISIALLVFDVELDLVFANPAAEELLDVSERQLMGSNATEMITCRDDTIIVALRQAAKFGQSYTEREAKINLFGGRQLTADCVVSPFETDDGEVALLLELHQLDRRLQINREEQLLAQENAVQAIVRGLGHEIKNPLGGLRGAAQLLEQEIENPALRDYTNIIIQEADRLQVLVDRMPGRQHPLIQTWVNIHEILERVRILVQTETPSGVRVINDYDPSIPEVNVDVDQLVQAILNVVRNASQAIDDQGIITIRTRIGRHTTIGHKRHRLVVRIDIIDNGSGIPEGMEETLFYPMVTGRAEGTGLGLSIAQSIISQHGGIIECISQPGETVFTVLLPVELNGAGQ